MKLPIKNNVVIEFHVPDFKVVKDFYSKLGFVIISEDKKGSLPGYLVMQRDDEIGSTILNFYGDDERVYQQSYFKQFSPETQRGYAVSITIPVSNIDKVYKQASRSLSDHIVRELTEKKDNTRSWRDFRMADPYGFYIRITELIDWGQR